MMHHPGHHCYVERVFAAVFAGAFGGIGMALVHDDALFFLDVGSQQPIFWAGIMLVMVAAVQATILWGFAIQAAIILMLEGRSGRRITEDEDARAASLVPTDSHLYGGWQPWHFVVLLVPVIFFFLNVPNESFASAYGNLLRSRSGGNAAADTGPGHDGEARPERTR